MKHPVNIQIALIHLRSKPMQSVVSLLSVTFGVSMYIFMNSFMNGVNQTQDDLAFSTLSHIRIFNESRRTSFNPMQKAYDSTTTYMCLYNKKNIQFSDGIKNTAGIIKLLESQPGVTGVAMQVNFSVILRNGAKRTNGLISGVEAEKEDHLMGISQKVIEGTWEALEHSPSGIILGSGLAENLSVNLHDLVDVVTIEGNSKTFEVFGIVETSVKELDKSKAWVNCTAARKLLDKNFDYATDIRINLSNKDLTRPFANKILTAIPYQIETWQEANEQLVAASQLRTIIAMAVSLAILLVAGFGIYNIMNMTISEKLKEIAILKAVGFNGLNITMIFLLQAFAIGISGGIIGVGFGYLFSSLINQVPFRVAGLTTLPIAYCYSDFNLAFVFGAITTLIAGYMPARKAARVDPILIIRG